MFCYLSRPSVLENEKSLEIDDQSTVSQLKYDKYEKAQEGQDFAFPRDHEPIVGSLGLHLSGVFQTSSPGCFR